MPGPTSFYARLAPLYRLVYADWEASVRSQAAALDALIRERWSATGRTVLDVACGIGTQALGLARLGYEVTASDLSAEAVEQARREADKLGLTIEFSVADMRTAWTHHGRQHDVVIACDNAIPHLLSDADILDALKQFHACLRPGGGCVLSVRDYDAEDLTTQQVKPFGVRQVDGARWLVWQVWDPRPPHYDLTMYFVEDRGGSDCRTHALRSTYYAVGTTRLLELMREAGFADVERIDGRFFQPLLVGTRA